MRVRDFGRASILEGRNAELFYESLSGIPARRGRPHAEAHPLDEPGYGAFEDDQADRYLETPPGTTTVTAPARLTPSTSSSPPPGTTIYVDIRLRSEYPAKPMTGIYVPQRYRLPSTSQVDIVLYLHGWKKNEANYIPQAYSVHQFWDKTKLGGKYALREGLDASGKNAILVVPTLSVRSYPGRLISRGLDWYLRQVLAALKAYGNLATPAPTLSIRNLVLAAHSGGGIYMLNLANSKAAHAQKIRECWGFDSMYGQGIAKKWRAWAHNKPKAKVYVYYKASRPGRNSRKLASFGLSNVVVKPSTARDHHWVPIEHWRARLSGSTFLDPKPPPSTTAPPPAPYTPAPYTPTHPPWVDPFWGFEWPGSTYRLPPMDSVVEDFHELFEPQ